MVALGVLVLSVSLLLQSIAAFLAFRLIKVTGKRRAWILITVAILLMAVRRSIPLVRLISGDLSCLPDLPNEILGLVLSICMVSGAASIAPLFLSIKQSEEAAKESREWLFTTLKSIGDAVIATNTSGYITFLNPTAQFLTGHEENESVGKPLSEVFIIIDEKTGKPKNDPVVRVIKTRDAVTLDDNTALLAKSGTKLSIDDSAAPIKDEKGDIIGVVLVFRDVTERKKAEEAIKLAHRELDQIFNAAADGMRVIDSNFNVLKVNDTFATMVGVDKRQIISQKCYEVFPGPHCHTANCPLNRVLAGEEYIEYDVEKERKNGEKIICIMTATPFRMSGGELVGIVEDFKDITERKRTEELLRQAQVARAERQRLFSVLDVLPAIVYLQSPDYSIPFANRTFRELFGGPEGRPCYEILRGLKEPCKKCRISRVLEKKEIQKWELTAPLEGRIYEMYDNLFTDIDNSPMVLELGIDITDRIQMEKAREDAERQLKEQRARAILSDRLRSLGEMATGMAHELNQPLLGIRGLSEHILIAFQRGWNLSEEKIREKIQLIIDQTDRMSHVIEHARMFARGADHSELLPVDCHEAIKSCMGLIGAQLRFRGVNVNCDLAEGLPPVLANPFSLEEVILNLINNARDALEEKMKKNRSGDSIEIVIRTSLETRIPEKAEEPGQKMVKIEIIDQGVGIPEDLMPKVFDTFFTTKAPDKGTGLGLAISKSIVESFQGAITIQSAAGVGTTVTIALPAMK
ncbi:MAG: PAS domain-containing protein [bacterium]